MDILRKLKSLFSRDRKQGDQDAERRSFIRLYLWVAVPVKNLLNAGDDHAIWRHLSGSHGMSREDIIANASCVSDDTTRAGYIVGWETVLSCRYKDWLAACGMDSNTAEGDMWLTYEQLKTAVSILTDPEADSGLDKLLKATELVVQLTDDDRIWFSCEGECSMARL